MVAVPYLERYSATKGVLVPREGVGLIQVRLVAPGGGGAGTSNVHFIPPEQYGGRGEDTLFGLHPAQTCMLAMAPGATVAYVAGNVSFQNGQPIVFRYLPGTVTGFYVDEPYYPLDVVYDAVNDRTTFKLSAFAFSPPFGLQPLIEGGPLFDNIVVDFHKVWYGVQGGGGGGIIGDQGTPGGSWGFPDIGPNGEIQGEAYQGGTGLGYFRIGPPGGVNFMGGNSGASYQDFGINGVNLCGSGGGGAPPPVGTTAPGEWSGTSGAAGAVADLWYVPTEGFIPWFYVGSGGQGGPAGNGGYLGGYGGHGMLRAWFYPTGAFG